MQAKRVILSVIIILILVFSFSAFGLAQSEQNTEQTAEVEESTENEDAVYINASRLEYQEKKTLLSGGVRIRKDETIINALQGELFRDEQKMILKEEIAVEYPDGRVKSKLLTAFLETEEYIFENEAVLNYILSDGDEMVLHSDYLKITGDNNSFTAEENVEIDYDGQKFRGDKANYNGETEMMELTGNVEIEEDRDWVRSDRATFNLKEGEEGYTAEGNVEIKMMLD
ncbi:OstA-like protein [Halanaerobium saccharolyticum]|uniref:OstA-like protein n=1 Tax=Halanaerobium saccharolyticum TaxID=43595 RepID=A0A4R6SAM9_9FIRM|nr:LptA/OstA family protein [Halanaerobium saccharolyticum]TDP95925.1 OstA-like protein [Halanaerobium saccharolyticum]